MSTGGLRYWEDGRDVPDVMLAMLDYPKTGTHPEFTLALRVNFKSGVPQEQFGFRFTGSGGVMTTTMSGVVLDTAPDEAEPGYTIGTFPKAVQEEFLREYRQKYPPRNVSADAMRPDKQQRFTPPPGHDAHRDHHVAFYQSVRANRRPSVEDAVFGFRAAGPALLSNTSYYEKRICRWDPLSMTAL